MSTKKPGNNSSKSNENIHCLQVHYDYWIRAVLEFTSEAVVKDDGSYKVGDEIKFDVSLTGKLVDPEVVRTENEKLKFVIIDVERALVEGEILKGYVKLWFKKKHR